MPVVNEQGDRLFAARITFMRARSFFSGLLGRSPSLSVARS
jgi:hypothetical protein